MVITIKSINQHGYRGGELITDPYGHTHTHEHLTLTCTCTYTHTQTHFTSKIEFHLM